MKLTKVLFLFLASVSLLASGCSDDEDETSTLKDCVPTQVTTTENGVSNTTTLGYNSDRKISSVKIEGDEPLEGTVAYSNGKPSKLTVSNSFIGPGYIEYTYNTAGQLTQMNIFSTFLPGSAVARYAFEYNSAGQLSKASTFFANPGSSTGFVQEGTSTFTYDSKGNILKESVYAGASTSQTDLQQTFEYTYDAYVNPAGATEKLIYGYSTPNNILTAISKDAQGTVLKEESFSRVYKYNTDNYPVEFTETSQSGVVNTSKVTYDCK